ncbi:MAG TPA: hypothetical protein VKD43_08360 [Xanthobacteraceae bacterium]|nr:hypothetical protein [Xanthobacteraceae bacterium]
MQPTYVRRHPDNSIDYDFYRRRAARLRSGKVRKSVRAAVPMVRPLIAGMLLLGMLFAMPTRAPQLPDRAADMAATQAVDTLKAN